MFAVISHIVGKIAYSYNRDFTSRYTLITFGLWNEDLQTKTEALVLMMTFVILSNLISLASVNWVGYYVHPLHNLLT